MSLKIRNVRLDDCTSSLYDITCENQRVTSIQPCSSDDSGGDAIKTREGAVDGEGGLLLPSLCHSHIHLDKCFILPQGKPLVSGDFQEALAVTADIKSQFPHQYENIVDRGETLIRQSIEAGVTSMRAHVEVDAVVSDISLRAAIHLKEKWRDTCDIQICAFMQEPFFSSTGEVGNQDVFVEILEGNIKHIDALGSAPYVESNLVFEDRNMDLILSRAMRYGKHADFHLDYDLTPLPNDWKLSTSETGPRLIKLIRKLKELEWTKNNPNKLVTIGHATRLTRFSDQQLAEVRELINDLPIYFVGLPQSDIYMMGRGEDSRGTINPIQLRQKHDFRVALSVNNVGNAFTPQGFADPLTLCPLGVAMHQDGTVNACRKLLESVIIFSKQAIGQESPASLFPKEGDWADFVILPQNRSMQSAALAPEYDRITIKAGKVVSRRWASSWITEPKGEMELLA